MTTINKTETNLLALKWQRIIAWTIDNFIIVCFILISYYGGNSFFTPFILYFCYYFFSELIFDRTLGKLILGIMVVDAYKSNYELNRMIKLIFVRTICRLIPFDIISFFFNDNGQLWHDNISNTIVIVKSTRSETYFT